MKLRGLFYMTSLLLGVGFVALLLVQKGLPTSLKMEPSSQAVLRVPQEYPTIQAAIDAAPEGATIQIAPGSYAENLTINKNLTLEGSATEATFLTPLPSFRDSDGHNPIITLQAPGVREISLRLRRLTVRFPSRDFLMPFPSRVLGLKVAGEALRVDLSIEQTAWEGLPSVFYATSFKRLELLESTFRQNEAIFSLAKKFLQGAELQTVEAEEARIDRNRLIDGSSGIVLRGKSLRITNNIIKKEGRWFSPFYGYPFFSGIALDLTEDGYGEVIGNSVAMFQRGIFVTQTGRRAKVVISGNGLFSNNYNLVIGSVLRLSNVYAWSDVLVEDNTVMGGHVGIFVLQNNFIEGGEIRLWRNTIMGTGQWGLFPYVTDGMFGVLISAEIEREKGPLRIDLKENHIRYNNGWGVAFNQDYYDDQCLVRKISLPEEFKEAEITGSGNAISLNRKGDLCPADYPWPPGFRK